MDRSLNQDDKQERRARLNRQSENYRHIDVGGQKRRVFIHLMRWGLPVIGITLLVLVFFQTGHDTVIVEDQPRFGQEEATIDRVQKLEMIGPEYKSYDKNLNPYTITADRAVRENDHPDLIILQEPKAILETGNDQTFDIEARTGDYDQDQSYLILKGDVRLQDAGGYIVSTPEIDIDLKKGKAETDQPVEGQGPRGAFTSESGAVVENNGQTIILKGRSKVILK
jgi:hypothetical protein